MKEEQWTPRYLGIFLLSASTLMLQVTYTRVFSITLWHHFVWMIVSIALLGYAASGTFISVIPRLLKIDFDHMLTATSIFFSLTSFIGYIVSNYIPFDPARLSWDRLQLLYITAYYLILSIPFMLSGLTIGLALERAGRKINKLYFSNLIGSALGSIIVLFLFGPLKGPGVVVSTCVVSCVSAISFALNLKKRRILPVLGWLFILLILVPSAGRLLPLRISPYKTLIVALKYPNSSLIDTKWNAFSRIDVVKSGLVRYAPGLSLKYEHSIPEQVGIIVDGDGLTAITKYQGRINSLNFTEFLPSALPYRLQLDPKVLIIDAGGGLGVLTALHHNASWMVAAEVNPTIIELVQQNYGVFSGNIYQNELVEVKVSEGRSYIQSSKDEYDVIELSIAHGASASSTGIYALSENYIYTVESFKEFIKHLSKDGLFYVSRWLLPPPREDIRIVSLAISALEELGAHNPEEHIAVIRTWGTLALLVKRSPLNAEEKGLIKGFCQEKGFDIVYYPGVEPDEVNIYNRFSEPIYYEIVNGMLNSENRDNFYSGYLYDIEPTYDERPFFFHFFKWNRLFETYESLEKKWQPLIEGGYLVPIALIQAVGLSMLLILLPLHRMERTKMKNNWTMLVYFFFLGIGYMLIEVVTIQKFILFFGHPVYSISAVIFSILLASGLGSYISGKIMPGRKIHRIILVMIGFLTPLIGLTSNFVSSILVLPFAFKLLVIFIVIAPIAFLMGIPFPLGIRMLKNSNQEIIPWAWATNGCASVLGSILPTILALHFGFSRVFLLGGISYLVCFFMISLSHKIS